MGGVAAALLLPAAFLCGWAEARIPGIPDTVLNWGSHGATGAKVSFWSNQWQIPATYPLGSIAVLVTFKTVSGATATFPYAITIIP